MSIFSGIWIPLITPFSDGAVDHAALRTLVKIYADAGVAGLVALGTTGEPAALNADERRAVLETVLEAAGELPVIVGLADENVAHLHAALERVNALPVAGVLTPAPCYVRPSQAALVRHFLDLADASARPLVIYDIPYRTGVQLELQTLLALAAHPRIQAVKDCAGSQEKTLALILDGRLRVLAGDDINILSTLCLGGSGAIAASAHVAPAEYLGVYRAIADGRLGEARTRFHTLAPAITALFSEPNPAPVKAALADAGLIRNELRPPMMPASAQFCAGWQTLRPSLPPLLRAQFEPGAASASGWLPNSSP